MAQTGVPVRAWVVTGAGMIVNLCLGCQLFEAVNLHDRLEILDRFALLFV